MRRATLTSTAVPHASAAMGNPERLLAPLGIAVLSLSAAPLPAQLPADSLFDRLIGTWVLRGTIARQTTTHDVAVVWMLGREYVRMHEVSRERAPNGAP